MLAASDSLWAAIGSLTAGTMAVVALLLRVLQQIWTNTEHLREIDRRLDRIERHLGYWSPPGRD